MDLVALAPLHLASYSAPSLTLSYCFVSLVRFRVQLSATLLTIKQITRRSVCLVERREPFLGFSNSRYLPDRARPTTTDKQTVPWGSFFFWFWSCDTFLRRQPRASTKHAYRQPRCRFPPRYPLEHQVEGGIGKEKEGGKGNFFF